MNDESESLNQEIESLLESLANRELTEAERRRLLTLLQESDSARSLYIRHASFDSMLVYEFPELQTACERFTGEAALQGTTLSFRIAAFAACMLLILAGYAGWLWISPNPGLDDESVAVRPSHDGSRSEETTGRNPTVTLVDSDTSDLSLISQIATVSYVRGTTALELGQRLFSGTIEVSEGQLELTFDSGAVVAIKGPAKLDLQSEFRGFLYFGRLSVNVPEQAIGFVIQTPLTHIRDLGTAFSVSVEDDGQTDLHVIEGVVEVTSSRTPAAKPTLVRKAHALRFSKDAIEPVELEPGSVQPQMQPSALNPEFDYVHWSFDSQDESRIIDIKKGMPLHLLQFGDGGKPPALIQGASGNGLGFGGQCGYAESTYPGVSGDRARTVAFWLRKPVPVSRITPSPIVSWGLDEPSKKWEITSNQLSQHGSFGAVRLDFGQGFVIGSTDLMDGMWHHIAVVFHGGINADLSTHVKLYVDGRLETVTGRRQQKILTETAAPGAFPVTVGRFIDIRAERPSAYLVGEIDELFIIDGALTPAQVVRVMERHSL